MQALNELRLVFASMDRDDLAEVVSKMASGEIQVVCMCMCEFM